MEGGRRQEIGQVFAGSKRCYGERVRSVYRRIFGQRACMRSGGDKYCMTEEQ